MFCDSHYKNIMDIQNRLPYSKVVYPAITVCFSCLMVVNVPGKPGFCFPYYCAVYDECKYSDAFWHADRVRLIVHYIISLSSLCKHIWRHWTFKMPVRYILSSVWIRLRIFSRLFIIQYMGLYVFSVPIFLVMIEKIYTLSYYNYQIGCMNYYQLFRVRLGNNGMRCMSLYSHAVGSGPNYPFRWIKSHFEVVPRCICHGDYLHWRWTIWHRNCKELSLNSLYEFFNIHILSNIKIIKQNHFHQVSYAQMKIINVKKN